MRGRKPGSPKVKDLAAGKLRVVAGTDREGEGEPPAKPRSAAGPKPPAWMKDRVARAEWARLLPDLQIRKQFIPLFASELARYCVAFGQYVAAVKAMETAGGPVTKSSKGVDMLSMHWVIANRAHETMARLAGDLGLNPVAQLRLSGLQLDLFQQPRAHGEGAQAATNPFGNFRRE